MNRTALALGSSLVALALAGCAGPEKAAPATPAAHAAPAKAAAPAAPVAAAKPAEPRASGRPELRYYEISAA